LTNRKTRYIKNEAIRYNCNFMISLLAFFRFSWVQITLREEENA